MELKEGMYVRTQKGIGKVVEHKKHESWGYLVKIIGQYSCYTHTSNGELMDVIKSSYNPIDLIEVGDYVNGYLVKDIDYAFDDVVMNNKNARIVPYIDCDKNNYIDDIKSIVTKEQFETMKYIIEK